MPKIRIKAAVVDTRNLKLYLEDGTTMKIPQGDPRLAQIIHESKNDLNAGRIAEIEIAVENAGNNFSQFEERSSGFVRFFRVTKSALAGIFSNNSDSDPEREQGQAGPLPEMVLGQMIPTDLDKALEEIMANAQPMINDHIKETETVVAMVDNKPIPGVETLARQIKYAIEHNSLEGVERFLARLAKVIDDRRHSVEDLLKFIERGDLPIADDGSIIIYKVLRRSLQVGAKPGEYVDCYTKQIVQRCGSYVCMDSKLVDPDRHRECSNGLHVARREYLRSFSGDVCVLAKVAPEDVIAVPLKDPNKMRVRGYHILFELTHAMHQQLKLNMPITKHEAGQKLLARAMSGDHSSPIERVEIRGKGGADIVTTKLVSGETYASRTAAPKSTNPKQKTKPKAAPKKSKAIDISESTKPVAPAVDPKKVARGTKADRIVRYLRILRNPSHTKAVRQQAAQDLLDLRKRAKKSWNALGHTDITDNQLKSFLKEALKPKAKTKSTKNSPAPKPAVTRQKRARNLFNNSDWQGLLMHKQRTKISWSKLGFSTEEQKTIERNTD